MSIEMPQGLQWLSYLAGSEWPQGDEDGLFALAQDWQTAATDLQNLVATLTDACDTALANYAGTGRDQMQSQFQALLSGDQSVAAMATNLQQISNSVQDCGTQIEYTKLQIISTLAIMAAEIAWALATMWGAFAVPAIEAEGAGIMQMIGRALTNRLIAHAAKVAEMPLWKLTGIEIAEQTGIAFVQDLAIQGYQKDHGHRSGIDWKQTLTTAAVGGISAGVATPIGHYVGGGLSKLAGQDSMTWWKSAGIAVATAVPAGLAGAGAGIVANGVITGQWEFDPAALLGGAGGGLVGGVHGVIGHVTNTRMNLTGLGTDGSIDYKPAPDGPSATSYSLDGKKNSADLDGKDDFGGENETLPPYSPPPPTYAEATASSTRPPTGDPSQANAQPPVRPTSAAQTPTPTRATDDAHPLDQPPPYTQEPPSSTRPGPNGTAAPQSPLTDRPADNAVPQTPPTTRPATNDAPEPQSPITNGPSDGNGSEPQSPLTNRPAAGNGSDSESPLTNRPDTSNEAEPQSPLTNRPTGGNGSEPQSSSSDRPDTSNGANPQSPLTDRPATSNASKPESPLTDRPDATTGAKSQSPLTNRPATDSASTPQTPLANGPKANDPAAQQSPSADDATQSQSGPGARSLPGDSGTPRTPITARPTDGPPPQSPMTSRPDATNPALTRTPVRPLDADETSSPPAQSLRTPNSEAESGSSSLPQRAGSDSATSQFGPAPRKSVISRTNLSTANGSDGSARRTGPESGPRAQPQRRTDLAAGGGRKSTADPQSGLATGRRGPAPEDPSARSRPSGTGRDEHRLAARSSRQRPKGSGPRASRSADPQPHSRSGDTEFGDRHVRPVDLGHSQRDEEHLNDCGPLALHEVVTLTGSDVVRPPKEPVGPAGMTAEELQHAAGGPLQHFDDHGDIGDHLLTLGHGATALVVDTYHGPADRYGVGAHAYVLTNEHGTIVVRDPGTGAHHPADPHRPDHVRSTHAVLYTPTGRPHTVDAPGHPLPVVRIGATDDRMERVTWDIEEFLTKFQGADFPADTRLHLGTPEGDIHAVFGKDHVEVNYGRADPEAPEETYGTREFWDHIAADHEILDVDTVTVAQPVHRGLTAERVWPTDMAVDEMRDNRFESGTEIHFTDDTGAPKTAIVRYDGSYEIHDPRAAEGTRPAVVSRADFTTGLEDSGHEHVKIALPAPKSWHRVGSEDDPMFPALARIMHFDSADKLRSDLVEHVDDNKALYVQHITDDDLDAYMKDPANRDDPDFRHEVHQRRTALLDKEIAALREGGPPTGAHVTGYPHLEFAMVAAAKHGAMNIVILDPNRPRGELGHAPGKPSVWVRRSDDGVYDIGINHEGKLFSAMLPHRHPPPGGPRVVPAAQIPPRRTEMLAGGPEPLLEGAALGRAYIGELRPMVPRTTLPARDSVPEFTPVVSHYHTPIHYMDDAEREQHRLFVGPDGKLYHARNGRAFDTGDSRSTIFVMDEFGNLYAAEKKSGLIQHSSFFGGRVVCAAGFIDAKDGHVTVIEDSSGHYTPDLQMNDYAIAFLRTQGLRLADDFQRVYFGRDEEPVLRPPEVERQAQQDAFDRAQRIMSGGSTPTRPFKIYPTDQWLSHLTWDHFPPGSTVSFRYGTKSVTATIRPEQEFQVVEHDSTAPNQDRHFTADPDELEDLILDNSVATVKVEHPPMPPRSANDSADVATSPHTSTAPAEHPGLWASNTEPTRVGDTPGGDGSATPGQPNPETTAPHPDSSDPSRTPADHPTTTVEHESDTSTAPAPRSPTTEPGTTEPPTHRTSATQPGATTTEPLTHRPRTTEPEPHTSAESPAHQSTSIESDPTTKPLTQHPRTTESQPHTSAEPPAHQSDAPEPESTTAEWPAHQPPTTEPAIDHEDPDPPDTSPTGPHASAKPSAHRPAATESESTTTEQPAHQPPTTEPTINHEDPDSPNTSLAGSHSSASEFGRDADSPSPAPSRSPSPWPTITGERGGSSTRPLLASSPAPSSTSGHSLNGSPARRMLSSPRSPSPSLTYGRDGSSTRPRLASSPAPSTTFGHSRDGSHTHPTLSSSLPPSPSIARGRDGSSTRPLLASSPASSTTSGHRRDGSFARPTLSSPRSPSPSITRGRDGSSTRPLLAASSTASGHGRDRSSSHPILSGSPSSPDITRGRGGSSTRPLLEPSVAEESQRPSEFAGAEIDSRTGESAYAPHPENGDGPRTVPAESTTAHEPPAEEPGRPAPNSPEKPPTTETLDVHPAPQDPAAARSPAAQAPHETSGHDDPTTTGRHPSADTEHIASQANDGHRNDCAPKALQEVVRLIGSDAVRLPEEPIGPAGMSAEELQRAAGAPLRRFEDRADIGSRLLRLGHGATALVVDTYHGPADRYGVGAHAYVLTNEHGTVILRDPSNGAHHPVGRQTPPQVQSTHAVVYTPAGRPHTLEPSGHPLPTVRIGAFDNGTHTRTYRMPEFLRRFDNADYPAGTVLHLKTPTSELRAEFSTHEVVLHHDGGDTAPRPRAAFWNRLRSDHEDLGITSVTAVQPPHLGSEADRIWRTESAMDALEEHEFVTGTTIHFTDSTGAHHSGVVRFDGDIEVHDPTARPSARPTIMDPLDFEDVIRDHGAGHVKVSKPAPPAWHRIASPDEPLFEPLARLLHADSAAELRHAVADHIAANRDDYAPYITDDRLDALQNDPRTRDDPDFANHLAQQRDQLFRNEIAALKQGGRSTGHRVAGNAIEFALAAAFQRERANIITLDPGKPRIELYNDEERPAVFLRRSDDGAYEVGVNSRGALFSVTTPRPYPHPVGRRVVAARDVPERSTTMRAGGPEPLLDGTALRRKYLAESRPMVPVTRIERPEEMPELIPAVDSYHTPIHYMDDAERENHRLFVGPGGKLYYARDGRPFDTGDKNNMIFVMDEFGNLYAAEKKSGLIQHSSFLGGRPVTAAGFIEARDGHITTIEDSSGHYTPDLQLNDRAIAFLGTQGMRLHENFTRQYVGSNGRTRTRPAQEEQRAQRDALDRAHRILTEGPTPTRPSRVYTTDQSLDHLTWDHFPPGTTIVFRYGTTSVTATMTADHDLSVVERDTARPYRSRRFTADIDDLARTVRDNSVATVRVEHPALPAHSRTPLDMRTMGHALPEISSGTTHPEEINNCAPVALERVVELTGSEVVRVPEGPVGPHGMSAEELQRAAGARLQHFEGRADIAQRLRDLGHGATALVVDTYRGPADRYGVGAHAYVLTNDHGEIIVHDPSGSTHRRAAGRQDAAHVQSTHAIIYTRTGEPHALEPTGHPLPTVRIGASDSVVRESTYGLSEFQWRFRDADYPAGTVITLRAPTEEIRVEFGADGVRTEHFHEDGTTSDPQTRTRDEFWSHLYSLRYSLTEGEATVEQPEYSDTVSERVWPVKTAMQELSDHEFPTRTTIYSRDKDGATWRGVVRFDGDVEVHDPAHPDAPPKILDPSDFEDLVRFENGSNSVKIAVPVPDTWHRMESESDPLFGPLTRILHEDDPEDLRTAVSEHMNRHREFYRENIVNDDIEAMTKDRDAAARSDYPAQLMLQRTNAVRREMFTLQASGASTGNRLRDTNTELALFATARALRMNIITLDPGQRRVPLTYGGEAPTIFLRRGPDGVYELGTTHDGHMFSVTDPRAVPEPRGRRIVPEDRIPPAHTTMRAGGPEPLLDGAALRKKYLNELRPMAPRTAVERPGSVPEFVAAVDSYHTPIHYMDAAEREKYRLFVGPGGKLYTARDGRAFDTGGKNDMIFVMDEFGNLYAAEKKSGLFQHSSFFGGRTVTAAGFIEARNGHITVIEDSSGHYAPDLQLNDRAIALLQTEGMVLHEDYRRQYIDNDGETRTRPTEADQRARSEALARAQRIRTSGPTPTPPVKTYSTDQNVAHLTWDHFPPGTRATFGYGTKSVTATMTRDREFHVVEHDFMPHAGTPDREYTADAYTLADLIRDHDVPEVRVEQPEISPRTMHSDGSSMDVSALHQALPDPAPRSEDTNNCAPLALRHVADLTGSDSIELPEEPVGPAGMTVAEFERAAGTSLQHFDTHRDLGEELRMLGHGAAAVVVDARTGPADRHGVGAHAYVMQNIHGDIYVIEPATGERHPLESHDPPDVRNTQAVLYTDNGMPYDRSDERPIGDRLDDVRIGATEQRGDVAFHIGPAPAEASRSGPAHPPPTEPPVVRRTAADLVRENPNARITEVDTAHFLDSVANNRLAHGTKVFFGYGAHATEATVMLAGNVRVTGVHPDGTPRDEIIGRDDFRDLLSSDGVRSMSVVYPAPHTWVAAPWGGHPAVTALAHVLNLPNPRELHDQLVGALQSGANGYAPWFASDRWWTANDQEQARWQDVQNRARQFSPEAMRTEQLAHAEREQQLAAMQREDLNSAIHALWTGSGTGGLYRGTGIDFMLGAAARIRGLNLVLQHPDGRLEQLQFSPDQPSVYIRQSADGRFEIGATRTGDLFTLVSPDRSTHSSASPVVVPRNQIPPKATEMLAGTVKPVLSGLAVRPRYTGESRPIGTDTGIRQRLSPEQAKRLDRGTTKRRLRNRPQQPPLARHTPTHYMDEVERESHRLFVGPEGRLHRALDGRRFDTTGNGNTIFVMDAFGNLYAAQKMPGAVQHTSFFGGRTVTAAGFIEARDGLLVSVTDSSGHYNPTPAHNDNAIALLRARGLVLPPDFQRRDPYFNPLPARTQALAQAAALARAQRILAVP